MYYIRFKLDDNKIVYLGKEKPLNTENGICAVAEVEELPIKSANQQYVISSIKEEVRIIEEAYLQEESVFNEETQQEEIKTVEYPEVTETYLACEVSVVDKSQVSEEQKAKRLAKINARKEIKELKQKLLDTDYQAIKYAEGWMTEDEYAPIKAERQAWRDRINELEATIK